MQIDVFVEKHLILLGKRLDLLDVVGFNGGQMRTDFDDVIDDPPEVLIEDVEEVTLLGHIEE